MRAARRPAKLIQSLAAPESEASADRSAVAALQNGKPVFTIEQIIEQLNRSGAAWDGIGTNPVPTAGLGTITYGFFDFASQVYSSEQNQFAPLSAAQRNAVRNAFAIFGEFLNLQFVEGPVASADINLGNLVTNENYYSAYASYPSLSREGGDIWINRNGPSWSNPNGPPNHELSPGQAGFSTLMHEIGHALGIAHPGAYNRTEGVAITYAAHAEYYQDSQQYTIMSYFSPSATGAVRTSAAATPLAHDIAALQDIYGANMATRTGDTVYGFNSNAGRPAFDFTLQTAPVVAIWDAGGRDTLDFSGWSTASRIDLAPGGSSDGGGQTHNVQIAYDAWIENATGGAGDDVIGGNALGNALRGGGGSDRMTGGLGGDRLEGGSGGDVFVLAALGDSKSLAPRSDGKKLVPDVLTDFISGLDKIDLSAIDAVAGTAADDAFNFIGAGAFTGQAGQLRFDVVDGRVHIYGDVDGNGRADLHIVATGPQILVGDFVL